MNRISNIKPASTIFLSVLLLTTASLLTSCSDDDPKREDTPELITKVTLTFTPTMGTPVVVTATDPDGEGIQDIVVDGPINLDIDKQYVLTLALINGLVNPNDEAYNITAEVEEEGDEHQFFFAWTNDVFSNPTGNGNIANHAGAVNYTGAANAMDENGRPLGITTTWTSSLTEATGTFRVLLKHQPDLKSDTSTSATGETDLDITFIIHVE